MHEWRLALPLLFGSVLVACTPEEPTMSVLQPPGEGPYSVGTSNFEVAPEYADIGDDAMHAYLLGQADEGKPRFITDILEYPDSVWTVGVAVPDDASMYGPAAGLTLPVVSFIAYPSKPESKAQNRYAFPYFDAQFGEFDDMLGPGETPEFAEEEKRYPLVILAHGAYAHGVYDVRHAQAIASHGYIVVVPTYGDERTAQFDSPNFHAGFLRPLKTKAVLDSLLASDDFGPHIDADNIGITGHSFGGFTSLALLGGPILGNDKSVSDARIKAAALAAPYVGGNVDGVAQFSFGDKNAGLERVTAPTIWFFGTKDEATLASFILPASKRVSGDRYVVELVDQPHIFEDGSWQDRDNWELLFFDAYLKNDAESLEALRIGQSMSGGNEDTQLFEYQALKD